MDYSHLHTYAPPQCLPENTGYTYALSSSYSSEALNFETLHKLDPVFDSPRMSRRSLRLITTGSYADDLHNDSIISSASYSGNVSYTGSVSSKDRSFNRSLRQQHNTSKQSSSSSHQSATKKSLINSSFLSQNSYSSHAADASVLSSVLDESLIREQTEVDHLWGLDDDDPKGGDTTVIQANGELNSAQTQTTMINGYTCNDCSMLSERSDVLTAFSASRATPAHIHTASTKVYTRDRAQKHKSREMPYYVNKALLLVRTSAMTIAALLLNLFHTAMLKLGYEFKGDDCKGTKHHETHTTVLTQSSRAKRVTGSIWHIFSYAGYFLQQAVRSVAAAGWFVSRKALSFLWLAIVSPGKAASGMFWWLGTGWYQLATLVSLLNVFFLTRCLPKVLRLLPLLIPLLLLLGLWFMGFGGLWSLLPAFGGLRMDAVQTAEDTVPILKPTADIPVPSQDTQETDLHMAGTIKELEYKLRLMAMNHSHHVKDHDKLALLVQNIQERVGQMSDQDLISGLITKMLNERFATLTDKKEHATDGFHSTSSDHEARILRLETLLGKLSEAIEEDRKLLRTGSGADTEDQGFLRQKIQNLEQEFAAYKAEFVKEKAAKTSCALPDCVLQKVDARVRESVEMMFSSQENLPESFLHWLSANYLSKADFNTRLQELELQILKNISHHVSITKQVPSAVVMERAVSGGISGITEEEAHVIVKNALKLYSQDRTGMVDFALESGGGSVLGTRCSETYETKTALMSLFGVPLWYFTQSPRVVIQPDMYPGNCWAFRGAQGYLVVRLSMMIYPTSFSLEHIPKSLSPTGNITSAPKDFAVFGLEDEYQENGTLLVHSLYDHEGEPLQIFPAMEGNEKPFQIVELRIYSNWGHTDYTCLYRFRAHGTPVQ
ncbi:SUN domain-containing protein 1 isoform X2 [Spea bombifrons]|uniref:SUN domain-containing protein 1 isoform X2 n=1 Tax=Spea bombifrons TaxID=233779 RepID=UPI002349D60E|nr:SUN domain-containing protein 1 isoform X2 [Spea bombifrons]